MGNCFTKNVTYEIVQITSGTIERRPPANAEPPSSTSRKPAEPNPSGWPPLPILLPWSLPNHLPLYILERELRSGEFGTTYICTERATGLRYACRSASKLRRADVEYMRREVTVLQRLGWQPNVAGFRDAFEDADSVHLVTELCSGGELLDRVVAAGGSYSERQAAAMCRDVLTVVRVCHSIGVMHRDIRPENFLLASAADDAPLKAVHFGHSVFIEQGKVYKDFVGSLMYVAPEVLRGNYGREIDVWSAGVILYILLCGSPPFWAETEKGILDAILVGQVDLGSSPWPTISESAKDLIRQMLDRDPQKRITAAQALEHPWLKEGGAGDRPIDSAVLLKATSKQKPLAPKATEENLSPEEIGGRKNDKEEAEKELNKSENDNVVIEEVHSSQDELDKTHEEELRKKMLAAGESGMNISGNNEQHVQGNNMQEMGVDEGLGNTEREANNYEFQDENQVDMENITDDKPDSDAFAIKLGYSTQPIQEMDPDGVTDTDECTTETLASGKDKEEVISTQGTAKMDKENYGEIGRRKSGRTETNQKMMDNTMERIKAKNIDAVPVSSGWKNDKKEADKELNKSKDHNVKISEKTGQHVQDGIMEKMGVDGRLLVKTEREVNNYEHKHENHTEMEDITDPMKDSDAFATKLRYSTQQIQGLNQDGVTGTDESARGASATAQDIEEVNGSQGTARADKETVVETRRRKYWSTNTNYKMTDNAVERTETLEIVPGNGRKNDKDEAEKELNKPESDNVAVEEVSSSQAELAKKLQEELRNNIPTRNLAGRSWTNISENDEQHVQNNSMQETGVDARVVKTDREVNNYEYQDGNHTDMKDITDPMKDSDAFSRKLGYSTQQIQDMKQDGVTAIDESSKGALASG